MTQGDLPNGEGQHGRQYEQGQRQIDRLTQKEFDIAPKRHYVANSPLKSSKLRRARRAILCAMDSRVSSHPLGIHMSKWQPVRLDRLVLWGKAAWSRSRRSGGFLCGA